MEILKTKIKKMRRLFSKNKSIEIGEVRKKEQFINMNKCIVLNR